ncbi:hypothetical protein KBD08_00190 [Candidatus Babeliales bacterium]|nr:hypothetical protein [Candidatus Babeliales bacterium]
MKRLCYCAVALWSMYIVSSDQSSVPLNTKGVPRFGAKLVTQGMKAPSSPALVTGNKNLVKRNPTSSCKAALDCLGCLVFCCAYHTEMCCVCVSDFCGCDKDNVLKH